MTRLSAEWLEDFWSKVDKDGPTRPGMSTRCWEWKGGRGGAPEGAHRVSWFIRHGAIPAEVPVLQQCSNRRCVRPAHLAIGAPNEAPSAPERSATRLSASDVAEIRQILAARTTISDLAKRFGVDRRTIYCIDRGLTHKKAS